MLRVPLDALLEGEGVLDEATSKYVARVHRLGRGAVFLAFEPVSAREALAEIVAAGERVRVRVGPPTASTNVPKREVTVIQTASKGSKIDDVLRDATELGATRFVIATGRRSVKRPEAAQLPRWQRIAVEAARQCGRGDVPTLVGPLSLDDALREQGEVRWLLDPHGTPVHELVHSAGGGATVLVIGPEGGFDPAELELAARLGYLRVALGAFVLRTETACAAALGALAAITDVR